MSAQTKDQRGDRIRLADLETMIATKLAADRVAADDATRTVIERAGRATVRAGLLVGYTPEKYGTGRWVSPGVVKRVQKALKERYGS